MVMFMRAGTINPCSALTCHAIEHDGRLHHPHRHAGLALCSLNECDPDECRQHHREPQQRSSSGNHRREDHAAMILTDSVGCSVSSHHHANRRSIRFVGLCTQQLARRRQPHQRVAACPCATEVAHVEAPQLGDLVAQAGRFPASWHHYLPCHRGHGFRDRASTTSSAPYRPGRPATRASRATIPRVITLHERDVSGATTIMNLPVGWNVKVGFSPTSEEP